MTLDSAADKLLKLRWIRPQDRRITTMLERLSGREMFLFYADGRLFERAQSRFKCRLNQEQHRLAHFFSIG